MFQDCGDLLMDEPRAAVFLAGVNGGRVEDVETPFPWILPQPLNKGAHDGLRDGLNGGALNGEGLR